MKPPPTDKRSSTRLTRDGEVGNASTSNPAGAISRHVLPVSLPAAPVVAQWPYHLTLSRQLSPASVLILPSQASSNHSGSLRGEGEGAPVSGERGEGEEAPVSGERGEGEGAPVSGERGEGEGAPFSGEGRRGPANQRQSRARPWGSDCVQSQSYSAYRPCPQSELTSVAVLSSA